MVNRQFAPGIKDAINYTLELKPFRKFILSNGVAVYAIDAGVEEVVQLELVFNAGNWYEHQNMVASTTNHMLKNGTSRKNAFNINEHFEYYGSYLNRACYNETAMLSLHSLTKHLHELLPVIQELITESAMPEAELDIYRQNMKQKLEVNLKKCDFVSNRLIDEYLFGINHPYGKYSSSIAYDALQPEQLRRFFDQYYVNGNCTIFIAGRLPNNIELLLNENFGSLPLNKAQLPHITHPVEAAAEKKYRIINDKEGIQGAIRIASHFPGRHHPHFTKAQVLNTLFGGYFGSRLMSNIREDKGYTYGIHSYMQNHVQQTAWMISTEAGKEVCEATIAEVYKEMQALREKAVPEEELLLVKNYLIGTILGDLDGPFHIIGRWKNIILNELGEDYFYTAVADIKNVTAKEIQELANQYLHPNRFYELVVV
ncbi:pitrilysin family protein [Agriterribacter sp.]|uniref:M16 family metallopeptidase n=1 Tax=Agriterribacter sp. TaxID=2821509 RepID=UPI002CC719A5|nr:pitrilysin family protein [Agriterribacter sp.]HRO46198.1 pitrilysin family protein [Agriterribacter sp.]HRQ16312.1 pitrilysin family protein [Agriterribacter sp.]